MDSNIYTALAQYLERLGQAEYQKWRQAKRKKNERYQPTPYHAELVRLLGKGDEVGFKQLKQEQGYTSALGF